MCSARVLAVSVYANIEVENEGFALLLETLKCWLEEAMAGKAFNISMQDQVLYTQAKVKESTHCEHKMSWYSVLPYQDAHCTYCLHLLLH